MIHRLSSGNLQSDRTIRSLLDSDSHHTFNRILSASPSLAFSNRTSEERNCVLVKIKKAPVTTVSCAYHSALSLLGSL